MILGIYQFRNLKKINQSEESILVTSTNKSGDIKRMLFIVQYPDNVSPSQRFRFELYKQLLLQNGFLVETNSLISAIDYPVIFHNGFLPKKIWIIFKGIFRRFQLLFSINKYDYIFIHLSIFPFGPPILEWLIVKLFKKKLIYDFDDAIWLKQPSEINKLAQSLKSTSRAAFLSKYAYQVSCGNRYLLNYAQKFNSACKLNPTCVDTKNIHNILANHDKVTVTVGWTGSFSTLKFLKIVENVLARLQEKYKFEILIICNQKPVLNLENVTFISWSAKTEVATLAKSTIGIMPLTKDEWSKGKAGFKLIQYLSLEIPAVASNIGVNKEIIEHGINGFLCDTDEDWYVAIEKLILHKELRRQMGKAGRQKIIKEYSLQSNSENFLSLFD